MCIIVLNTSGLIGRDILQACADNNPDGMGLMYAVHGEIKVYKELKDFELFYNRYKMIREKYSNINIGLHFRIKTHGEVNLKNVHPFFVNKNLAFMHNGIIDIKGGEQVSDTIIFNEKVLKQLPDGFLTNKGITYLIKESIGWSKLLFMDSDGYYTIINENTGNWKGANWFSNYSYLGYSAYDYGDDYYWNSKTQRYEQSEDVCEFCGKILHSEIETDEGFCLDCLAKYNGSTCFECQTVLKTESEVLTGLCEKCQEDEKDEN